MKPLSIEERWAQACIRQALPDSQVEQHDDGSRPSMYDLKIVYPDGTVGAAEVTRAVDPQQLQLWKLVRRRGKPWIEPNLAGGWQVRILPSTIAKELLPQLPGLLRELERSGIRILRGDPSSRDGLAALAGQLGIVQVQQTPTDYAGSIYIMPPEKSLEQMGGYSPLTGDPLATWLGEWLSDPERADNLSKLANSRAPERHMFVLVPPFEKVPFAVNDLLIAPGAPLPTIPPALPPEITHVWAMSMWDSGDGFRWSPDNGWARFAKVEPTAPEDEHRFTEPSRS
jgi:hypothetical protein